MRDLISKTNNLFEADDSIEGLRKSVIDQVKKTKDEELLDRIYTVLNKSGLVDRISDVLERDTDTKGYVDAITQIIIDTPGTYQDKYNFIDKFPTGYVDIPLMLSGRRVKYEELLGDNEFVRRVFDNLKRVNFGTAKGPGEFALAVLSPHIKITGKGDLNIGDEVIEVKASAGKEVSSGGGRLGTPGLLHSDDVEKKITKHLGVTVNQVSDSGNLGLAGLTKISQNLKPSEREDFGRELFDYIFHGLANTKELVDTFKSGGDLRDAFIKANYEAYKNETDFTGIMIMNFALGELHYFKDVNDLVRHIYGNIGVYLVSKDKAAQARQILVQVTLAPFREPKVTLPKLPSGEKTPEVTKEFEDKVHEFAVDFARKQNITDPKIISNIVDTTLQSLDKGMQSDNIMKKLKKLYPIGSSSTETPTPSASLKPQKITAAPSVVTGRRVELTPKGKQVRKPSEKGLGREKRGTS